MPGDWFRSGAWNPEEAEEFERRLKRARPHNRPQYLRIKALALRDSSDPKVREAGQGLLLRALRDYPDNPEVPSWHGLLGEAYRREGKLRDAERHFRLCADLAPQSRSGTTGLDDLSLAEVLTELGGETELAEAGSLLQGIPDKAREHPWFNSDIFRFRVAWARLAAKLGERDVSRKAARLALEVARVTEPQLPRHPTVGVVDADPAVIQELWRLAGRE